MLAAALSTFAISLLVLGYTFAGYSGLIRLLARFAPPLSPKTSTGDQTSEEFPPLTVIVVARNEQDRIIARIENLLETDYPTDRLEILIVSDASDDQTDDRVRAIDRPNVHLLRQATRAGKAAGLNAGIAQCQTPLIAFTDARQRFTRETLPRLARWFVDPQIGAVSGSLEIQRATSQVGQAVGKYWEHEKALRLAEARLDSCIGCTGAVYAIRRELFSPIPADTILDDVVIPMQIALRGYRVLHDDAARAVDPQPLEPELEKKRKRRTLAGNFQMLFRHPQWLLPWRNRLWLQLLSHKYLRVLAPLFLASCFVANLGLLSHWLFQLTLAGQILLYLSAAIGLRYPHLRSRLVSLPAGFVLLNLSAASGLWHYLRGSHGQLWASPPPPVTPPAQ